MRARIATISVLSLLMSLAAAAPAQARPAPARATERPSEKLNPPSGDIALTGDGDSDGFHLLVADAANPGSWWEAATLSEPGFSTDRWIGQYCLTGSGKRAAVVYAPREFANSEHGMYAGAFAAIVDLVSGEVTKLAETTSLAHYNPGCGTGETVVFSALGSRSEADRSKADSERVVATRPQTADPPAPRPPAPGAIVPGQLPTPAPAGDRVVAAKGRALVAVDADGALTPLSRHRAVPFRITPDADGGIAFQTVEGDQATVRRYTRRGIDEVARAPVGSLRVRGGANGRVLVLGPGADRVVAKAARAPKSWRGLNLPASVEVSHRGGLAVMQSVAGQGPERRRVKVRAHDTRTGAAVTALAVEGAGTAALSAALGLPAPSESVRTYADADHSTVPWDPDAACAMPRNDPDFQVYQPTPKQVTWAANLAVHGELTMTRAAGFWGAPMPAYSPQGLFPRRGLNGGGHVPVQIMLGVLAQESNMWQASDHTADGYSGNIHQGGFYGRLLWDDNDYNDWSVNWDRADCGYGVAQVTTGMHKSDTELTKLQQQAVMVDYAANVAAGLRILEDKWNQTRAGGLVVNNGDPKYLENWWFALWAYNSGYYPEADKGKNNGAWGVGWLNNPANEIYPPDRGMFLRTQGAPPQGWDWDDDAYGYGNSKYPNYWSYPERVIGWAATPLRRYDYQNGGYPEAYRPANWSQPPEGAQPGHYDFCVASSNECDEHGDWDENLCNGVDGDPCLKDDPSPCSRADLRCWWRQPIDFVTGACATVCGTEYPEWSASHTPPLAPGLAEFAPACYLDPDMPWNARIIDDVDAFNLGPDGCGDTGWRRAGKFRLKFADNGATPPTYPSKIDFHQVGGGFGGHYWFANTWAESGTIAKGLPDPDWMHVTGTWTLDASQRINGWGQVMVHLPSKHAHTQQARYKIHGVVGGDRERYLPTAQRHNGWVQLGTYRFDPNATQSVSLSNVTHDGIGDDDIAWDAVAFVPLPSKPKHFVVAMGDSYISGEGVGGYYTESDRMYGTREWNACRRSALSWPRLIVPPGWNHSFGTNADVFSSGLDFHSVACSGAEVDDITRDDTASPPSYWTSHSKVFDTSYRYAAEGQFREVNQLDSGVLSADTTLVLLSIGGNDIGFDTTIAECAEIACATDAKRTELEDDIRQSESAIRSTIKQVQEAAPNAQVVVAGYPMLFWAGDSGVTCSAEWFAFSLQERVMFNELSMMVRDQYTYSIVQLNHTYGWNIALADTIPALSGHGACAQDAWLHSARLGPNGGGDFDDAGAEETCFGVLGCISRESYHPNVFGAAAYRDVAEQSLVDVGYP
ncbi:SGNH/GDSL hydrolase family protein [Micromonospora sp. CPCC 205371]|nr:SGNH/GDSL hydrolase family protein [Micromonospora sp. CPCC 205371]